MLNPQERVLVTLKIAYIMHLPLLNERKLQKPQMSLAFLLKMRNSRRRDKTLSMTRPLLKTMVLRRKVNPLILRPFIMRPNLNRDIIRITRWKLIRIIRLLILTSQPECEVKIKRIRVIPYLKTLIATFVRTWMLFLNRKMRRKRNRRSKALNTRLMKQRRCLLLHPLTQRVMERRLIWKFRSNCFNILLLARRRPRRKLMRRSVRYLILVLLSRQVKRRLISRKLRRRLKRLRLDNMLSLKRRRRVIVVSMILLERHRNIVDRRNHRVFTQTFHFSLLICVWAVHIFFLIRWRLSLDVLVLVTLIRRILLLVMKMERKLVRCLLLILVVSLLSLIICRQSRVLRYILVKTRIRQMFLLVDMILMLLLSLRHTKQTQMMQLLIRVVR